MNAAAIQQYLDFAYIAAVVLFILALKWLSSPVSARRGVLAGEIAAGLVVHRDLYNPELVALQMDCHRADYRRGNRHSTWHGARLRRFRSGPLLSHAFGALSAAMIGIAEYYVGRSHLTRFEMGEIGLEVIIGSLTFTGSLIAAGKLQELLPQRPIVYKGQNIISLSVLTAAVVLAGALVINPENTCVVPDHGVSGAGVWRNAGDADWWRRYADRDLVVELLCRIFGGVVGICAEQQSADSGGRA